MTISKILELYARSGRSLVLGGDVYRASSDGRSLEPMHENWFYEGGNVDEGISAARDFLCSLRERSSSVVFVVTGRTPLHRITASSSKRALMATLAVLGAGPLREFHEATVGQKEAFDAGSRIADNRTATVARPNSEGMTPWPKHLPTSVLSLSFQTRRPQGLATTVNQRPEHSCAASLP